jgi:ATP-dependent Lon protease
VPGRGLTLTGQLGDVMKESAHAALSYVRTRVAGLELGDDLRRNEVHVHVPAGATPKDGPSAGVTIATALVSLVAGIPVRSDVAMTGEITLRGRLLPVGGIREKALAALRRGIPNLVLPHANRHDLEEIPPELAERLEFHLVKTMDDVLPLVLEGTLGPVRRPRSAPARSGARIGAS